MADFVDVCDLQDIPVGKMKCFDLVDRQQSTHSVLVAHTNNGCFAVSGLCTHEDILLCDGNLTDTVVRCPLHGSRFELRTGTVLDDPAEEDLHTYPIEVVHHRIRVKLPD